MLFKKKKSPPPPVTELHQVLDHGAAEAITAAVEAAEVHTSAEIMVRLAALSPEGPTRAVAEAEYLRLGLGELKLQNGVLIYVSLNRHAVEIVVGPAAAEAIPQELWQKAVDLIAMGFRDHNARMGILSAIELMSPALAEAFPPCADNMVNLPNVAEDSCGL